MEKEHKIERIEKRLADLGYSVEYYGLHRYRYRDNFHIHDTYLMDIYRVDNGMFIKCKTTGRPRYFLCKDSRDYPIIIDFSQTHFLKMILDYFPDKTQQKES